MVIVNSSFFKDYPKGDTFRTTAVVNLPPATSTTLLNVSATQPGIVQGILLFIGGFNSDLTEIKVTTDGASERTHTFSGPTTFLLDDSIYIPTIIPFDSSVTLKMTVSKSCDAIVFYNEG